jgi:hypothetical protein
MAAEAPVPEGLEAMREERIKHGLLSHEAEQVFDRILRHPLPQVLISTRSIEALYKANAEAILKARKPAPVPEQSNTRSNLTDGFVTTEDDVEGFIIAVWQELLGIASVGPDDDFFHLGGHSLLGTQVLARLQEHFGVTLSLRTIFEATTPALLAQSVRLASWASDVETIPPNLEREEIEL